MRDKDGRVLVNAHVLGERQWGLKWFVWLTVGRLSASYQQTPLPWYKASVCVRWRSTKSEESNYRKYQLPSATMAIS